MEEYNLKEFWQEIHTETEVKPVYVREVIRKKHCNVISQTIHRQKILICLYTCFLAMSVATSIWDMCIIGSASLSLWTASAFLLFLLLSSIGHYQLLIRSADLYSIKDSGVMLRKRLRRRINIVFPIYLIFFYRNSEQIYHQ